MRIKGKDGVWERLPRLSEVAKAMVRQGDPVNKETGKISDCLVCDSVEEKRPAVCHTLFETVRPDGKEAMAAMGVCRAHRAQWRWIPAVHALDGQHRAGAR